MNSFHLPFQFRFRNSVGPLSTFDYEELARRAVPGMVWAYLNGAAEDHETAKANREAFSRYALLRRPLTGVHRTSLSVTVADTKLSLPVLLAPTGLTGVAHWEGERAAARGAESAGTIAILSTASSWSIEEVATGTERRFELEQ